MKLDASVSAVVTGGASGLGAASARALAELGVKVAIFDLNLHKGSALADEIGGIFCNVDVVLDESVAAGFARAREAHGQERLLVNCAGSGNAIRTVSRDRKTGEIRRFLADDFAWVLNLNTVGTFRCITHSAAGMLILDPTRSGERGVIINTASVAAEDGQIGQAAYSASKAAVVGMTLPIARDLAGEAIRVNTILPGIFDTPAMDAAPDALKASLGAAVPFPKRLGQPSEYASLMLEMVRNGYFNGAAVRLDGAIRMSAK
jgi:NAD(P)-dependent dehydrogenase (short-subunit alcohol dehydrogenase family)